MEKRYAVDSFTKMAHGGDYNPDQWKNYEGIVDEDIRLMDEAGCNVMSVGIFSWTMYEPREGEFDFSYMDMVLDKLNAAGKKAIMATPSGARPAWMAKKYPEVLKVNEDGRRILYTTRHNHCYTSPVYREKVRIINEKLSERYGNHPAVIGWHLSNEYGSECFCDLCAAEFRNYLKKKFDNDISKLNEAYWTYFWSHEFGDFDEIDPPGGREFREYSFMGLTVDWARFRSDMQLDFIKNEIEAIRKYSDKPITTNYMDIKSFKQYDYVKWAKELDFISWDNYPLWHSGNDCKTAADTAFVHDFMRSCLNKPFYLMESTPSLVNWGSVNRLKKPGMHKLSSIQAVAHGSDSVQYFQWRKGRGGFEKFHGAVVDHIGTNETREFKEVAQLGNTLSKLDEIVGSSTVSRVAVVYDWENRMALEAMAGFNEKKKYAQTCIEHYYPFWRNGVNVDIIDSVADFSKYDLVVMPMLYMIKPGVEDKIEKYVSDGGCAVMTYLSAMVDENDLCYLGGFPAGKLRKVFGIWAEETDSFWSGQAVTNSVGYKGNFYKAADMAGIIHSEGADVICKYNKDFYAGEPAVTVNSYGKGKAYYIAMRDEGGALLDAFYSDIIKEMNLPRATGELELPTGVTAHTREDDKNRYLFIENYTDKPCSFEHSGISGVDMESGEEMGEYINLDAYGVKILKIRKD